MIAALMAAADFYDLHQQTEEACELRTIADWWNASLERWLYVEGTPLAKACGVEGYYVRVRPQASLESSSPEDQNIVIKNRPADQSIAHFSDIVSVDALALVRYGLRKADDPRILNTVKVIDALLKSNTSKGPIWHRYNRDGYGEKEDGSPFDGTGVGAAGRYWGVSALTMSWRKEICRKRKSGCAIWRASQVLAVCFRSRSGCARYSRQDSL